jgi:hypothetical protein
VCGATPEQVSRICLESKPEPSAGDDVPAFEIWRQRIADGITSLQGTNT